MNGDALDADRTILCVLEVSHRYKMSEYVR